MAKVHGVKLYVYHRNAAGALYQLFEDVCPIPTATFSIQTDLLPAMRTLHRLHRPEKCQRRHRHQACFEQFAWQSLARRPHSLRPTMPYVYLLSEVSLSTCLVTSCNWGFCVVFDGARPAGGPTCARHQAQSR